MNKKIMMFILSLVIIFISIFFYYTYANNAVNSEDTNLINNVVEIEKNLVLAHRHSISFNDFKNKISPFVHSYYRDSYFEELERLYNGGGNLAVSVQTPLYEYISKVYSSKDEEYKYIYAKIPEEGVIGQAAKLYKFKKENSEWHIIFVSYHILSDDMKELRKDDIKFTDHNGIPIEYESIKIIE
jgi:hypothetical protein